MNQFLKIGLLSLFVALAGGAAGSARADLQDHDMADRIYEKYKDRDDDKKRDKKRESEAPRMRVSLDQATNIVRRQSKGRVIGTKTDRRGNSIKHRIKVIKDGHVRTYTVDGVTGRVN